MPDCLQVGPIWIPSENEKAKASKEVAVALKRQAGKA